MMGFEKDKRIEQKWGNNPHKAIVGGKECSFDSDGEERLARYLELLKTSGHIKDWNYEQTTFWFKNVKTAPVVWKVDFDILNNDGTFEYYEYKGAIKGRDVSKFRRVAEHYPLAKVTLVLAQKSNKPETLKRIGFIAKYAHRITYAADLFRGAI
jgi:hypothetical protein